MDTHRNIKLDGLRGVAILLVVLHHGLPDIAMSTPITEWIKKFVHAGWIGVDLFFLLSGYLITGILIREKQTATHFFRNFYARRILRIWPPYLFCVSVILACLWAIDPNSQLLAQQRYLWLHAVNLGMYIAPDTFRESALGVTHMWSLAVEEHFYLLWPMLVYRLSLSRLLQVIYVLLFLVFLLRLIGVFMDFHPYYFVQTFARIDSLACGGLLAILGTQGILSRLHATARVTAFVCTLLGMMFFLTKKGFWAWDPAMFSVGLTLVYVFFAALFIMILNGTAASLLSNRLLRTCGTYSYGWYLLDGTLRPAIDLGMARVGLTQSAFTPEIWSILALTCRAVVPFALAWLMFTFLERPFLTLKRRFAD